MYFFTTEYLEVVERALATTGPNCNKAIKDATRQLEMYLQHRVGWRTITEKFK